jgi:hypothetical protein
VVTVVKVVKKMMREKEKDQEDVREVVVSIDRGCSGGGRPTRDSS